MYIQNDVKLKRVKGEKMWGGGGKMYEINNKIQIWMIMNNMITMEFSLFNLQE